MPTLSTELTPSDSGVGVRYTFDNHLSEAALVFCHVYSGPKLDVHATFHTVEGWEPYLEPTSGLPILWLTKAVLELEPGVTQYVLLVPLAARVEAGDAWTESFFAPFPTKHFNPFRPGEVDRLFDREVVCRQLGFRLGYVRWGDVEDDVKVSDAGGVEVYGVSYDRALAAQKILTSDRIEGEFVLRL